MFCFRITLCWDVITSEITCLESTLMLGMIVFWPWGVEERVECSVEGEQQIKYSTEPRVACLDQNDLLLLYRSLMNDTLYLRHSVKNNNNITNASHDCDVQPFLGGYWLDSNRSRPFYKLFLWPPCSGYNHYSSNIWIRYEARTRTYRATDSNTKLICWKR